MVIASAACFAASRRLEPAHAPPWAGTRWSRPASSATAPTAPGWPRIVVFFAGMIGTLLVLTLFLQFGEHFSAIHAGLTLAPFALGSAVGAGLSAAVLAPRFGRNGAAAAAAVIAGAGSGGCTR